MPDDRKRLHDMTIDEVSLVDEPANEDARVVIVKAASQNAKEANMAAKSEEQVAELLEKAGETIEKQSERIAVLEEIAKRARISDEDDGEEFDEDEDDDSEFADADAEDVVAALLEDAADALEEQEGEIEKVKSENAELRKSAKQLVDKVEKMRLGADPADDLSEIVKGASPEFQKRFLALEAVNAANELTARIEKARGFGVGKPEDVAALIVTVEKRCGKETAEKIEVLLKSAGAAIRKSGALQQIGEGGAPANSPIAKARVQVDEIRKAHPNLTHEQAMSKYWADNPDAYAEYRDSRVA